MEGGRGEGEKWEGGIEREREREREGRRREEGGRGEREKGGIGSVDSITTSPWISRLRI